MPFPNTNTQQSVMFRLTKSEINARSYISYIDDLNFLILFNLQKFYKVYDFYVFFSDNV